MYKHMRVLEVGVGVNIIQKILFDHFILSENKLSTFEHIQSYNIYEILYFLSFFFKKVI